MERFSSLSETLGELMIERGLSTEALGAAIGMSGATVRHWRLKAQMPMLSSALRLADFFDCSLEFLVGRTDTRLGYTPQNCPPFYQSLMRAMKRAGKSRYRVVRDTAFGNSHFSRWKRGGEPSVEMLLQLSAYLGCTLDYLVGRES